MGFSSLQRSLDCGPFSLKWVDPRIDLAHRLFVNLRLPPFISLLLANEGKSEAFVPQIGPLVAKSPTFTFLPFSISFFFSHSGKRNDV